MPVGADQSKISSGVVHRLCAGEINSISRSSNQKLKVTRFGGFDTPARDVELRPLALGIGHPRRGYLSVRMTGDGRTAKSTYIRFSAAIAGQHRAPAPYRLTPSSH